MIANSLPISAQLLAENQIVFRKYNHLIIQHLKSDTAEIAIGLSDIGCNLLHLVAIDYSVDSDALSSVRERGIDVSVESFARISGFVSNFISHCSVGDLVVWDVGGYAADVVSDPRLARKIRFVLEDTNGGLWRYQSSALQCPVIEVASIENKKIENAFVGRRIVETSEQFFESIGLNMPQQEIVVVGFGGIGQSVCAALRLEGVNAAVVEIDQRKLALPMRLVTRSHPPSGPCRMQKSFWAAVVPHPSSSMIYVGWRTGDI
jgi:S-adenosylhomocysteine hydrolase